MRVEFADKFLMGDVVRVAEYNDELFEVTGYIHETMVMYGEESDEIYYNLRGLISGETITRTPEDISFVRSTNNQKRLTELKQGLVSQVVDDVLDKYNDLMLLYQDTQDDHFLNRANEVMDELKLYFKNK